MSAITGPGSSDPAIPDTWQFHLRVIVIGLAAVVNGSWYREHYPEKRNIYVLAAAGAFLGLYYDKIEGILSQWAIFAIFVVSYIIFLIL